MSDPIIKKAKRPAQPRAAQTLTSTTTSGGQPKVMESQSWANVAFKWLLDMLPFLKPLFSREVEAPGLESTIQPEKVTTQFSEEFQNEVFNSFQDGLKSTTIDSGMKPATQDPRVCDQFWKDLGRVDMYIRSADAPAPFHLNKIDDMPSSEKGKTVWKKKIINSLAKKFGNKLFELSKGMNQMPIISCTTQTILSENSPQRLSNGSKFELPTKHEEQRTSSVDLYVNDDGSSQITYRRKEKNISSITKYGETGPKKIDTNPEASSYSLEFSFTQSKEGKWSQEIWDRSEVSFNIKQENLPTYNHPRTEFASEFSQTLFSSLSAEVKPSDSAKYEAQKVQIDGKSINTHVCKLMWTDLERIDYNTVDRNGKKQKLNDKPYPNESNAPEGTTSDDLVNMQQKWKMECVDNLRTHLGYNPDKKADSANNKAVNEKLFTISQRFCQELGNTYMLQGSVDPSFPFKINDTAFKYDKKRSVVNRSLTLTAQDNGSYTLALDERANDIQAILEPTGRGPVGTKEGDSYTNFHIEISINNEDKFENCTGHAEFNIKEDPHKDVG